MVSCFYKKISILLAVILSIVSVTGANASKIMWPSAMNLYNDTIDFDKMLVSTTSTASNTKKGFLFTGDANEVFYLGCGHIAINVSLSGKGHTYMQYLQGFKKHGIKITLILVNDRPPVGAGGKDVPKDFQNPYFYMMDFSSINGEWQKYNFDRIVEDYAPYVDNWVIGNEINSQLYNYYGPATLADYTKVYCDTFKIMHDAIKKVNKDAHFFISFDQCWDMPAFREGGGRYDKTLGPYRYNAKDQLEYINKYLGKDVDWGVALHPYPAPLEDAKFWDDEYAGFDAKAKEEKDRPYLLTAKNFEIALAFLNEKRFLTKDKTQRKIILSEIAITSHNGEELQAAGLYYLWEKVMKYDEYIDAFLYNAQTDLPDGYNFGLTTEKGKKRLSWLVFKDMDKQLLYNWCKDLLDRVLEEYGYVDMDTVITKIPVSETKEKKSAVIIQQ